MTREQPVNTLGHNLRREEVVHEVPDRSVANDLLRVPPLVRRQLLRAEIPDASALKISVVQLERRGPEKTSRLRVAHHLESRHADRSDLGGSFLGEISRKRWTIDDGRQLARRLARKRWPGVALAPRGQPLSVLALELFLEPARDLEAGLVLGRHLDGRNLGIDMSIPGQRSAHIPWTLGKRGNLRRWRGKTNRNARKRGTIIARHPGLKRLRSPRVAVSVPCAHRPQSLALSILCHIRAP